jgi:uncharacterized protein (TIGR02246 family)
MTILKFLALAACASVLGLSCTGQGGRELSQPEVDTINESTQTFIKGTLAKDWATVANLYAEDAVLQPPNQPAVKGRPAIRAWLEQFPPVTDFKANNVKVEGREDLAYVVGTYTMTIMPPGASGPVNEVGKYVEVRRKQSDGSWLIAVDMFNSDLPATPPAK